MRIPPRLQELGIALKGLNPQMALAIAAAPFSIHLLWSIASSYITPPSTMSGPNKAAQVDAILVSTPGTLGGVSPSDSPTIAAQKLTQGLVPFEDALDLKLDGVAAAMLTQEAKRLRETAMAELTSVDNPTPGSAVETDHYDVLMGQCQITLPPVDCILIRYMGDGIKMMELATTTNNAELYFKGRVRMQAAGLALFPRDPIAHDGLPLQSLIDYRRAVLDLVPLLPSRRIRGYRQNSTETNMQDAAQVAEYLDSHRLENEITENIQQQNPLLQPDAAPQPQTIPASQLNR